MGNLLTSPGPVETHAQKLQREADQLFKQRNEAFERSRQCYDRGDHAGAKHWSLQGKELDARAKQTRQQAANQVFADNNQGRSAGEVDLHGLTIKEATAVVERSLQQAQQENRRSLVLIVGRGLHSGPEGPKLKPAITHLINKHNLRCTVGKPNEGCLFVEFVRPEERGWVGMLLDNCVIC